MLQTPSHIPLSSSGAYLVPYLVLLIIIGIPLFFLELAVGQRIRRGSIGVWHYVCPRLGGIGFSSCIVSWGPVVGTGREAEGLLWGTGLTAQSPGRGEGQGGMILCIILSIASSWCLRTTYFLNWKLAPLPE